MRAKEYIVGDKISLRIFLRHRSNLTDVTAVFVSDSNEDDVIFLEGPLSEDFYSWQGDEKRSIANLTAEVTGKHQRGTYKLNYIVTNTAGDQTFKIMADELGDLGNTVITIGKEPSDKPTITGRRQ